MFNRIIVALKFTSASKYALEKGIGLAKDYGADLHIFHALDYTLKKLDDNDPTLIEKTNEAAQRFEKEIKPLFGELANFSFGCKPADPALEICKLAKDKEADLIIVGCHQLMEKSCIGRIDYVGMTILEMASCPVMLVPSCE
jgi:nucleotide-binding universal stress UspA family protein